MRPGHLDTFFHGRPDPMNRDRDRDRPLDCRQGLAGTCGALHVASNLSTSRLDQLGEEGIFLLAS